MTKIEKQLKIVRKEILNILEMKLTEIEEKITKKNIEIYNFTIPYLSLSRSLKEYLSDEQIKNLNSRYKNSISKYWNLLRK